jgi:hypothetical protein
MELTPKQKMQAKMNEIRRQKGLPEQTYTNTEQQPSDPYILENSADLKELPLTLPLLRELRSQPTVLRQKIFRKPENSNATYYSQLKAPLGKYEKTEVSNLDHNSYFVFDNNGVKTNVNSIMPIYYTKVPLEPITAEPITAEPITAGSKLRSKKQRKNKRSNKKQRAHTRRKR